MCGTRRPPAREYAALLPSPPVHRSFNRLQGQPPESGFRRRSPRLASPAWVQFGGRGRDQTAGGRHVGSPTRPGQLALENPPRKLVRTRQGHRAIESAGINNRPPLGSAYLIARTLSPRARSLQLFAGIGGWAGSAAGCAAPAGLRVAKLPSRQLICRNMRMWQTAADEKRRQHKPAAPDSPHTHTHKKAVSMKASSSFFSLNDSFFLLKSRSAAASVSGSCSV